MLYRTRFTVTGNFGFPFDMLRHDSCYPLTEVDATAVAEVKEKTVVQLEKIHAQKNPHLTPGRWASFLWRLDLNSIITERI